MSYPAIRVSVSRLARLSEAQRRAVDQAVMNPAPAAKPAPRHIEIADIPNAAQAALISLSFHPVCRYVTDHLKRSTIRFGRVEFNLLRDLGLAERKRDTIYHKLTSDGEGYSLKMALRIAKQFDLHIRWNEILGFCRENTFCTCGYTVRLFSTKQSARQTYDFKVARHFARAAGTYQEPTCEALNQGIQQINETFGGSG